MDPSTLETLRALEKQATPGPWTHGYDRNTGTAVFGGDVGDAPVILSTNSGFAAQVSRGDTELIVALRNAIPALLALASAPVAGGTWQPVDNFNAPDERLMACVDMNRKFPIPVLARWHRGHGWISVPGGYDFQPTHVKEFDATLPAPPVPSEAK